MPRPACFFNRSRSQPQSLHPRVTKPTRKDGAPAVAAQFDKKIRQIGPDHITEGLEPAKGSLQTMIFRPVRKQRAEHQEKIAHHKGTSSRLVPDSRTLQAAATHPQRMQEPIPGGGPRLQPGPASPALRIPTPADGGYPPIYIDLGTSEAGLVIQIHFPSGEQAVDSRRSW